MLNIEDRAMTIACATVKEFGEGGESEQIAANARTLWKDHPAYRAALTALTVHPLIGKAVHKTSGDYQFDGEVVGVVHKKSGEIRFVVEDDRGLLLIMNARQIS
jgi:hypothetical protein